MRPVTLLFASVVLLAWDVSAFGHHKLIRLILAKSIMKTPLHIPIPLPIPIVSHKKKHHTHVHELHKFHGHHHVHHGHHGHHHHDHHDLLHDHHHDHDHHHHDAHLLPFSEPLGFGHGFKSHFGDMAFGGHDLDTPAVDFGHAHETPLLDASASFGGLGDDLDGHGHGHDHGKLDLDLETPLDAADSLSHLPADFGHLGEGHGDLLDGGLPLKKHLAKKSSS